MTTRVKTYAFRNEAGVKKHVKMLLERHGWFWWMPAANGYGMQGVADICAIRGGIFMAVETKFGKNKPSTLQLNFLRSVMGQQCFAFVVTDQNVMWLDIFLQAFDKAAAAQSLTPPRDPAPEDGAALINAIREMQLAIPPTGDTLTRMVEK